MVLKYSVLCGFITGNDRLVLPTQFQEFKYSSHGEIGTLPETIVRPAL